MGIMLEQDQYWMRQALDLAKHAQAVGEVPIGAVVIDLETNQMLGQGYNSVITLSDPSAHAEIVALRDAGQSRNNYRLINTALYVTLEPCMMCAMAMIHARVSKLVYAAADQKLGIFSNKIDLFNLESSNHQFEIISDVLSHESSELIRAFFKARRNA